MYNYPPGCDVCETSYGAGLRRAQGTRTKVPRPDYTMSIVECLPEPTGLGCERWRCSRCGTTSTVRLLVVTAVVDLDPDPRILFPGWPESMEPARAATKPKRSSPRTGWVYFAAAEDGSGPVKVGFSADPNGRLKQLQTGSGNRLVLLGQYEASEDEEARVHASLADHHVHGEWFVRGPHIDRLIAAAR